MDGQRSRRAELSVPQPNHLPRQRLAATGQVELITSPYYHPILPLLIDFTTASKSESGAFDLEFRHPEHARLHLDLGLAQFERTFGSRPSGIWLPEMALSTESLRLLPDYDVKWTIGNSDLLVQTLGETALFSAARPWLGPFRVQETATSVLFRDKELSDLVGFVYNSWESKVAAADFVSRIERLARELPPGRPGLLVIALDGENAWEHYPNDGWDFLDTLYARLEASSLPTVTISDYLLQVSPEFRELPGLNPGSWIDSNFSVWRGSPSHDTAWRLLAETTKAIGEEPRGLHSILRAECSDWFWWLSDRHWSTQASEFERLFRANLRQAYRSSGISPPEHLEHPIRSNT
ncbi:MAG: hypothetical protein ABIK62_07225 [candidate division WOR-3 bacterium]